MNVSVQVPDMTDKAEYNLNGQMITANLPLTETVRKQHWLGSVQELHYRFRGVSIKCVIENVIVWSPGAGGGGLRHYTPRCRLHLGGPVAPLGGGNSGKPLRTITMAHRTTREVSGYLPLDNPPLTWLRD